MKYFFKGILCFLLLVYFVLNIFFFFELEKILIGEEFQESDSSDKNKEKYLMQVVNFNETFFIEKGKIKFLYNSYQSYNQ